MVRVFLSLSSRLTLRSIVALPRRFRNCVQCLDIIGGKLSQCGTANMSSKKHTDLCDAETDAGVALNHVTDAAAVLQPGNHLDNFKHHSDRK